MNCAIDRMATTPDTYVPLIGCIQGSDSLEAAFEACIPPTNPNHQWLLDCARSAYGRELLFRAGQETAQIKDFNFVPWVVLDGVRVNDAFYALEENLCSRLDAPKPKECSGEK